MLPTHFSKLVSLLCGAEVISLSFSFQKHFLCFIISAAFLKILLEPYLIKMWNECNILTQYSNFKLQFYCVPFSSVQVVILQIHELQVVINCSLRVIVGVVLHISFFFFIKHEFPLKNTGSYWSSKAHTALCVCLLTVMTSNCRMEISRL